MANKCLVTFHSLVTFRVQGNTSTACAGGYAVALVSLKLASWCPLRCLENLGGK